MRDALSGPHRLDLAWRSRAGRECLRIAGWSAAELHSLAALDPAEIARRLQVLPSEVVDRVQDLEALQPVAGRFEVAGEAVYFTPRFPFQEGTAYSLLLYGQHARAGGGPDDVRTIERPAVASVPTTEVLAVYPSADILPVNQLRLYVHFSAPMSEGWAARAVRVHRADTDEPLAGVFLDGPELWDRERRRLTLLLDPGRIKRGLVPNRESGYPLVQGVPVVVRIAAASRDAAGRPLRGGAERRYEVGPAVRTRVEPAGWRCDPPVAGSAAPLRVEFDRPLDRALIERCLSVNDAAGRAVAGHAFVGPGERSWQFQPRSPWAAGRHALTVDPRLEDLAGNSVTRVFDRDLARIEDAPRGGRPVAVEFTCVVPTPEEAAGLGRG